MNASDKHTDSEKLVFIMQELKQLQTSHASTLSRPQTLRATLAHSGTNKLIGTAYKDKGLYRMEGSSQRMAYLSTISAKEMFGFLSS
ncbi:hypothetical protein AKJ16_DCAP10361 [Drosera capensis]